MITKKEFETMKRALGDAMNYIHHMYHKESELHIGRITYSLHGKQLEFNGDEIRYATSIEW